MVHWPDKLNFKNEEWRFGGLKIKIADNKIQAFMCTCVYARVCVCWFQAEVQVRRVVR